MVRLPPARIALISACFGVLGAAALTRCFVDIAPLESPDGADAAGESTCDEAALASDPLNCGRCGHDCLEGGCASGLCLPVSIFNQLASNPNGIYVSSEIPFVTIDLPLPNGAVRDIEQTAPIASGLDRPTAIRGEGTTKLYWTMGGEPDASGAGIGSLQNGTIRTLNLFGAGIHPRAIALLADGGDVFWTNDLDEGGTVMRAPRDLTHGWTLAASAIGDYVDIDTDGTHVWVTSVSDHTLYRLDPNADGGAMTQHVVFVDPGVGPTWVAQHGGKVIIATNAGTYVGVIDAPLADSQPLRVLVDAATPLAPSPLDPDGGLAAANVFGLFADDAYAYWTDKNQGAVVRVSLEGGAPELVAYVPGAGPNQLFVTDKAVYFTGLIDGNVYRVAK